MRSFSTVILVAMAALLFAGAASAVEMRECVGFSQFRRSGQGECSECCRSQYGTDGMDNPDSPDCYCSRRKMRGGLMGLLGFEKTGQAGAKRG